MTAITAGARFNWNILPSDDAIVEQLSNSMRLHRVTARVLANRGLRDPREAHRFLECRLKDLSDPFLLDGMSQAVERVLHAIKGRERILVHGDYDVDGMTGAAVLCEILGEAGAEVLPYIPDRVAEGYGISREAIDLAFKGGYGLMITVDCGAAAIEEIAYANERGLDVIVVDHHELKDRLPDCIALLHPRRSAVEGDFHFLSGVGMAFKLAHGLVKEGLKLGCPWARRIDLRDYLDRVAIGTVADLVPLKGENKILVKRGLERLRISKSVGLSALVKAAQLQDKELSAHDIAFKIAPRMNAAGRVGTAYDAVRLLLTRDPVEAQTLAQRLEMNNRERQRVEQETCEDAMSLLESAQDWAQDPVLVLERQGWPLGVIGIVASRIVRLRHRPVFVISSDGKLGKGSARSIKGFHLGHALKYCHDLLEGYGGHACAAGIKIRPERIPQFRSRINEYARQVLCEKDLAPSLDIDAVISIDAVSLELAGELARLAPFGQENPHPLFAAHGLRMQGSPQRLAGDHLKLRISQNGAHCVDGIGFGLASWSDALSAAGKGFSAAFEIHVNDFQGQKKAQMVFKDFRVE